MNRKELQLALEKLNPEDFQDFVRKFGGTHESPESVVRAFVDNPSLERRLCQLLDLNTEEEKSVQAALDAAKSAKYSAIIAAIAAAIALLSFLLLALNK